MATPLLSHPFRLAANGRVFTRDQSDDAYKAERLALLCTTEPGERVLVPGYGISDPAFAGFDENMLRTQVDLFGPYVVIESVSIKNRTDSLQDIEVIFNTTVEDEAEEPDDEDEV